MKNTLNKIIITIGLVSVFLFPLSVPTVTRAADAPGSNVNYVLLEPLPCIDGFSNCDATIKTMKSVKLSEYVPYMFTLLIALSAVTAVVMIVVGGLQYITTDSWGNKKEGKERAKNAVLGLIMVLCTYLILRTVNPSLVNISSTIVPPLDVSLSSTPLDSFYNQLQSDVDKMDTEIALSRLDLKKEKSDVETLKKQREGYLKEIKNLNDLGLNDFDPQVRAYKALVVNIEDQIASKTSSVTSLVGVTKLQLATKTLTDIAGSGQTGETYSTLNDMSTKLDTTYTETLKRLTALNSPASEKEKVDNQYYYGKGLVTIQKAYADSERFLGQGAIAAANSIKKDVLQGYVLKIKDETLKQELKKKAEEVESSLRSKGTR